MPTRDGASFPFTAPKIFAYPSTETNGYLRLDEEVREVASMEGIVGQSAVFSGK